MQQFEIDGPVSTWWCTKSTAVEEYLSHDGIIIVDGPGICADTTTFQQLADMICGPLSKDNPEHHRIEDDQTSTVNRPTPFPKDRKLLWHNENTFARMWPRRIMFGCQEIGDGGQTPTADMADVYDSLSESTRTAFARRGITYIRRLGMDLGLDWRQVYSTNDPAVAEQACTREGTAWSWDKRGEVLITRQSRPAVIAEPASGRPTLVAQVLHWHPGALDSDVYESLSTLYDPSEFPKNCAFGDGSTILDDSIDELMTICAELEEVVEWQPDRTMVVNNLRRSHARNPYSGTRRLMVAVGSTVDCDTLDNP